VFTQKRETTRLNKSTQKKRRTAMMNGKNEMYKGGAEESDTIVEKNMGGMNVASTIHVGSSSSCTISGGRDAEPFS